MRPLFGPRTVVEAAFLVAVPVIALEVGLRWYVIVVAGGIAYLLVLGVEAAVWRDSKRGARGQHRHRDCQRSPHCYSNGEGSALVGHPTYPPHIPIVTVTPETS